MSMLDAFKRGFTFASLARETRGPSDLRQVTSRWFRSLDCLDMRYRTDGSDNGYLFLNRKSPNPRLAPWLQSPYTDTVLLIKEIPVQWRELKRQSSSNYSSVAGSRLACKWPQLEQNTRFYCWRIWKFCGNWIIPGIVGVLGWISVVTLWIYSVIVVHFDDFVELVAPGPVAMSTIITSCAAGCDLAISAVMIFYLQRSKTGVRKSTDIINRMVSKHPKEASTLLWLTPRKIIFTFNTGLPTSMSALLSLIALHAMSNTFIYIFFYLLTGRFYTNSLLVTLNARKYILEGSAATPRVGFNIPRNQGRGAQKRVRKESSLISIHFTRKTTEANENIPLPVGKSVPKLGPAC
ncbi:hypothetical protein VNI00_014655 [Paramarasmius palmivorus]|uniref:DUF6534 domain-containing protein n=1 Tax=Paramarasmius palmivorus TaxID=297713 RepID=A0AAW0BTF4_9AGAR